MMNLKNNLYSVILKDIYRNESSLFLIKNNGYNNFENFSESLPDICQYFYLDYSKNISTEPFSPFCSIIKQFTPCQSEIYSLLNHLDAYPAHKEIFMSYLSTGISNRVEEILPFDFAYEKSKIYKSFLDIFNFYSKDNTLLILLENINTAPISTINWLKWLLSNSLFNDFKFILTLSSYRYYKVELQNEFDDLIQQLELNGLILELSNKIELAPLNSTKKNNYISSDTMDNLITFGDNYYNFFCLTEALDCYLSYYNYLNSKVISPNTNLLCDILIKLGNTYCLQNNYDESLLYYDMLLNHSLEHGNDYFKLIAIQKLSMINILKNKFTIAENLAKQSYTLAKKYKLDELLFNSYTLIFWINEKAKYRTNLNKFVFTEDFIALAIKYKKKNMLAYFLTHSFNNIEYASPEDNQVSYYNAGQKIATELDNQNCILSSYLKTALVYAVRGFYDVSISYYKKVEILLKEMKDFFRLAQTYNGMGYYYLTNEDYITANNYYNLALTNLRYSWNFDEICMAIFNKGFNFLLASNYKKANECFNTCLSILNVLKVERLRLTTLTRLYGIIGLNNFYLGNYYKAYSFLSNMKTNTNNNSPTFKDDDDEFFLSNFLQGLLLRVDGNYADAKIYFEKAHYYLDLIEGSLKCLQPRFIYEYVALLNNLQEYDLSERINKIGIDFCTKNNYEYYLSLLTGNLQPIINICDDSASMDWVIEAAKQQASLNELNSKVDEINFLNIFQENLSSLDDLDKALVSSMTLIENRFALDYSFMFTHDDNHTEVIYSSTKKANINDNLFNIIDLLKTQKTAMVYPSNTNTSIDLVEFKFNLQELLNLQIHSFIYIPIIKDNELKSSFLCVTKVSSEMFNNEITLNLEFLRIINLAIKQLFETIQRIKGQQQLLQSAYTDMLTGLCNRQGFYNTLSNLFDNTFISNSTITLLYIDLDNFKYYNDTFGHKIGDEVLIWFAEILTSVAPQDNCPTRFGGDEFLLMLQNYSNEQVYKVINIINSKLKESTGFTNKISDILCKDIYIPSEKLLSCSIGIVTSNLGNSTMSELIDCADKAMYKAKNSGKNQFVIYNNW